MSSAPDQLDELTHKLNRETAKIAWRELEKFFAQGKALSLAAGLDLIQVAKWMAEDNAAEIQKLVEAGQFGPVSDEDARLWHQGDSLVWAIVSAPFVLVQPVK